MTVRIGDTVPANRRRDDVRPAESTETRRRLLSRGAGRKHWLAWLSHLDSAFQKSRA